MSISSMMSQLKKTFSWSATEHLQVQGEGGTPQAGGNNSII